MNSTTVFKVDSVHKSKFRNCDCVELMAWLFCEPNPIPLNTALCMCGLIKPVFRLPYVPLNQEQREV